MVPFLGLHDTSYDSVGHETTRVDYLHVCFVPWMGVGEMITVESSTVSGPIGVTN